MNRRSAITIAAGMVLTVMVAAGAIALGVTGPTSQASAGAGAASPTPEVRTVTRTIERREPSDDGSRSVVVLPPQPSSQAAPSFTDDDGWDDDDAWEDDHDEGDDHDDHDDDDDDGGAEDHDDD
jgi:hypothetical protein